MQEKTTASNQKSQPIVYTETKDYRLDGNRQELPGFDDKYVNIVDYILKITEEIWEQRALWVIYETYDVNAIIHSGAGTICGAEEVVKGTLKTLFSFPDRKMDGEAVIWSEAGVNHFYSSHHIHSVATNLGATDYGDATGKKVTFRTMADCLITKNKIVEEWLVRDNLHLVEQLGFDPVEMAKRDQTYKGTKKSFFLNGLSENSIDNQLDALDLGKPGELILSLFEHVWKPRDFQRLTDYYRSNSTIHAICDEDLHGPSSLKSYLEQLFASFPQATVQIQRVTCNEKPDEIEVAARWEVRGVHSGNGFFSPASGEHIIMLGISQFIIKDGKIIEEWMVFDGFDVLCQIHAGADSDRPFSQNGSEGIHLYHKKLAVSFIEEMNNAVRTKKQIDQVLGQYLSEDLTLNVTKPFEEIKGVEGYTNKFWMPLLDSFPDLEIQPYILMGGSYEGRDCVSFTGNMIGTFHKDWLGIPSTSQPTWIRFAAHFIIEDNKISRAWYFLDMLDVMRQAGFNFFPNKGIEWVPPGPMTGDGIVTYPTNAHEGQKSLALTNAMLDGLGSYDGQTLDSMGQEQFWDVQNMMWYGPCGIGTTKGLQGFQQNHQLPFLVAFPDRGITSKTEEIHFAQFGDGNYSCDFGFPSMHATHLGDGWLGLKATGRTLTLRVMDFWRREGDRLKENWVFIDMINLLEQMDVDVFALLKEKTLEK